MRKGWRKFWLGLALLLMGAGTPGRGASPEPYPAAVAGGSVRMTLEIGWVATRPIEPAGLDLELSEGQVREVLGPVEAVGGPERRGAGWRLGGERVGRVRARVEAPVGASLVFLAGGQTLRIPLAAVLEGPQRTPGSAPLEITVERLSWDALSVALPQGDGIVAPGAVVPLSVGYNILTAEPTEVAVTCTAELRPASGGEPGWRHDQRDVVVSNPAAGQARAALWNIPAPRVEGTYLLELRCTWEPSPGGETTRLGRWFRRRWNPRAVTSAARRLTLTVVDPRPASAAPALPRAEPSEVESIDLARPRDYRPTASGRAPLATGPPGASAWAVPEAALVEASRRDRLRGWIVRSGPQPALAAADATGLAWSAIGLKVAHPGRPHRLSLTVAGPPPTALGVALVASGASERPQLMLDACASGPLATSSWLVWPDDADPVLVLVNRDPAAPVQLGTVTLTELPDVPPPPALADPGPESGRTLGLYLSGPAALDRFGGGIGALGNGPADPFAQARNFARYAGHCGATTVVLAESFADRVRRRALDGQASEDALGPDRLDLLLRVLDRQGLSAWLEPTLDGPLPGLPAPDSDEARARGLVRVDRQGRDDGATYHPLHPDVREALKRRVASALAARGAAGVRPRGLLIRLGRGPTLLGGPDTGADDATYARFVRETFGPETTRGVPGLEPTDPDRFSARAPFLAGSGRNPWLNWRAKGIASLYAELAETAHRVAPGSILAVVTPGLDDGPAGTEARRVDLSGLAPIHAWRAVGFDLETWPSGNAAPLVLRGAGLSTDDLAHDLATSPELDAAVLARPRRGLLLAADAPGVAPARGPSPKGDTGLRLAAPPLGAGSPGDELLGHALAVLDVRWMLLSAAAIVGQEERLRQFARVFRALPAADPAAAPIERPAFGVAVRTFAAGSRTYLSLANDTPYPIRLETMLAGIGSGSVSDLGRGLRLVPESVADESRLVLDLPPFGVAGVVVGTAGVRVTGVTPYPSEGVLAGLQARSNELANQLSRLGRVPGASRIGPPNPGFEPPATPAVQLTGSEAPAPPPSSLAGWQAVGAMGTTVELDAAQPHAGRGSLRIVAPGPPSGALSDPFPLAAPTSLTLQGWFRADRPDAKVRLWIEGQAAGQPVLRQSELAVSTEWTALAIRAANLPGGGLESARLRLELLSAGSLWVDDLTLSGETFSEAERLNTRRALIAALHAYREKRYADFARLAASHWARHPGLLGTSPVEGPGTAPGEHAEMIRTGDASALPPGRRLR